MKRLQLFLIFFILLLASFVVAQPVNNPNFPTRMEFVNFTELVGRVVSVDKITNQTAMSIFGTEYQVGDDARTFLQLVEADVPVENATCLLDVFYPDLTPFQTNAPMNYHDNGLYYYDYVVPNATGVFMMNVFCHYITETSSFNASSFNIVTGNLEHGGVVDLTYKRDDQRLKIKDVGDELEVNFSFLVNSTNSLELMLFFEGKLKYRNDFPASNGYLVFSIFNGSSGEWFNLSNTLLGQRGGADQTINNWLGGINVSNLLVGDELFVKLKAFNGLELDKIEIDYLKLFTEEHIVTPITDIRGGGEVHVSDYVSDLEDVISNIPININTSFIGYFDDLDSFLYSFYTNISLDIASIPFVDYNNNFSNVLSAISSIPFIDYSTNFTDVLSQISSIPFVDYNNNFTDVLSQVSVVSGQVSNLDSDLIVHNSNIESLLSGLEGDVSSLSSSCNADFGLLDGRIDVLESKLNLILSKLNIVTSDLNLEAVTHNCLEGSVWSIEVTATDNFANYLNSDDISCNVTTNLWGVNDLVWNIDSFDFSNECGYDNDTITWVVNCENI